MKGVILAIKPKYAEAVLSGEKKYEFRKHPFPKNIKLVIIYASNHVGKIVGWFEIKKQVVAKPEIIWNKYSKYAGISQEDFFKYYNNCKQAVCLEIQKVHKLEPPIDPFQCIKDFIPPQSYRYLKENDYDYFIDKIKDIQIQRLEPYLEP
jgi:predicted transcriptional regulator